MSQVYLITGASTGFGNLTARALAKAGHIVFAGMYRADGNASSQEQSLREFANEHHVDIRPVPLNLLSQESVDAAVARVLNDATGMIDGVIHNAGHMNFGPAEAFTPEQMMQLYDVNVVGCQRLNQAILPHMRQARRGHLIWVGSSSTWGAKSPYLGAYFAAKAAQDHLAQCYAHELMPWGIETTIVSPGVFVTGTSHFTDAMKPAIASIAGEYDGEGAPTRQMGQDVIEGTAKLPPLDADPNSVAEVIVKAVAAPRGEKPFRVFADPSMDGAEGGAAVNDNNKVNIYRRAGWMKYLKVWQ